MHYLYTHHFVCQVVFLSPSILAGALDYEALLSTKTPHPGSKNSSLKLHLLLLNKIGDVVGHVTSLLTPGSLVAVVMHLLVESGEEVRTKVLKIVARKLEEGNKYFSSEQVKQNIHFYGVWQQK